MAARIVCGACNTVMQVADELRGKKVKCKSCSGVVSVPIAQQPVAAPAGQFAERQRMPAPPPVAPAKRRVIDDDADDDRSAPRRKRKRKDSGSMLGVWLSIGGGVFALILVIVLVLALRPGPTDAQPNVPNNPMQPVAQNQPPIQQPVVQQPVNAVPEKRNVPPPVPDPAPGETLKGEQIYQRLLNSTVWIVASHKVGAKGRPAAQRNDLPELGEQPFQLLQFQQPQFQQPQFQQPGIPQIPQPNFPNMPNIPKPNFPKPNFPKPNFPNFGPKGPNFPGPNFGPNGPGMNQPNFGDFVPPANQTSNLTGSTWSGNETLAGYGKLTFQFITNRDVIMLDNDGSTRGSFIHTGNTVKVVFGGGIVYTGNVNGNSMSGSATNGQNNWTWNLNKTAGAPGNTPGFGQMVVKSEGSGSLIDRKHRLVVTNVHVVGNTGEVSVYFPDFDASGELIARHDAYKQKPGIRGRVVMKEERADLALVQLDRLPEGVQPLALAKSKAKVAQQVHSVGNPGASQALWIYSPGKVRQVFKDQWKIPDDLEGKIINYDAVKLETDSAINAGDSGGPLVDDRACMVGVAHGHNLLANNLSIFIEASEVRQLLERYYRSINDTPPPQ
jgi:S1-C subfamily serine protease